MESFDNTNPQAGADSTPAGTPMYGSDQAEPPFARPKASEPQQAPAYDPPFERNAGVPLPGATPLKQLVEKQQSVAPVQGYVVDIDNAPEETPEEIMGTVSGYLEAYDNLLGETPTKSQEPSAPAVEREPVVHAPTTPPPVVEQKKDEMWSEPVSPPPVHNPPPDQQPVLAIQLTEDERQERENGKITTRNVFDGLNVSIDVNKIVLSESNKLVQMTSMESVFNAVPTMKVILTQSGWWGEMSALSMAEINSINLSTNDPYTDTRRQYQILHKHIESSNLGKIGFNDFLKATAFYDVDSLYYGCYCMTFPGENEFEITCPSCQKKTVAIITNNSLFKRPSAETIAKVKQLRNTVATPQELVAASLLSETHRVALPDSKMVVELRSPTLEDYLENLNGITPEQADKYASAVGIRAFVSRLFMLDIPATKRANEPRFFEVHGDVLFEALCRLSKVDGKTVSTAIEGDVKRYIIGYSLKPFPCRNCNDTIPEMPVNMERVLFTQIAKEVRS
jgi:hypothetical protein